MTIRLNTTVIGTRVDE